MQSKNSDQKVSIIIVNWNGYDFLKDCLISLKEQSYENFEVVFVDNSSTDGSLQLAKQLSSSLDMNIKFVELPVNKGFTGGNNEGLLHSSGIYVALLNPDTIADRDWIKKLAEALDAHPDAGIAASKIIVEGENVIDSAGDGYSTFGHAFKRGEGRHPDDYSKSAYVFGACAGAALYRRSMIEAIKLFDEDFFLIFEDTDLNFRAQLSGWKCFYVHNAMVYHKVGASVKKIKTQASYFAVRNDKIVKIKNLPTNIVIKKLPLLLLGEVIWFFYYLVNGCFRYYLKANFDTVKNIPTYLKKRREVMMLKKVSDADIQNILTSGFTLYGLKRIRRYLAL